MRATTVTIFALVLFSGVFMSSSVASAHVTGASWEVPVGKYTADLGYDPVTFTAGQYTRFDFSLWVGTTTTDANGITGGTPADFAQIWIRLLNGQDTLLATGIWKQPIGPTTLLYEFVDPGTYSLEVSFRDAEGNDIAVQSFPITVVSAGGYGLGEVGVAALGFLAGCVLAGGVAIVVLRNKKRRHCAVDVSATPEPLHD